MTINEIEKREERMRIHKRIWIQGLITTVIFTVIMYYFFSDDASNTGAYIFQGTIFYLTWLGIQYLFHLKLLKQLK